MSSLSELAPYLVILLCLVIASAFFSGTEVAMFSLRRADREHLARSERKADRWVLRLLARPQRLIATLLLGNEAVNVSVSAVLAGMAPMLYPGRDEISLALLTTMTALPILLLIGEITPKTVAIKNASAWARAVSRPLVVFGVLVTPIRSVVLLVADILMRPFGGSTRRGMLRDLSEQEFRNLVDAGSAEGEVDARERRLIHRVFEFGDKTVAQVMEPRDKIFALSYELPLPRLVAEVAARGFSRVPVYQKNLDKIRGVLHAKDLLGSAVRPAERKRLGELLHEPLYVPPRLPLARLFRIFKQRKIHLALVVDEYGKLVGLITMEDLLEELFGEIRDERELQKARALLPGRPTMSTGRVPMSSPGTAAVSALRTTGQMPVMSRTRATEESTRSSGSSGSLPALAREREGGP
ncbi:hemolysin family protein [Haliangium ochraceum]|uniref:CBS domain containing protein n=1 Tax=Haliangium ochraceum (strain DSM 14365 / JCM 11303 / SMP-2) TaxID=502025 RepID=D0LKP5_HALO1|nr:hemolysin family protein [Haliangium ochraceum]ACY15093.1 protein of unknown function DUF21 [Haliangium ochraceum DSM 14365]